MLSTSYTFFGLFFCFFFRAKTSSYWWFPCALHRLRVLVSAYSSSEICSEITTKQIAYFRTCEFSATFPFVSSQGTWYSILEFLNVAGVVTNSFLVAFTSSYGRSWEGEPSKTNTTETIFNSTTNTTEQVIIVTEHVTGLSRLWLIIGFEVRLSSLFFFWYRS